ncbi:MAG: hypothetical protein ACI9AD_001454 [Nitriliruptoraceae bacterium]|jgi:hypothetical protein
MTLAPIATASASPVCTDGYMGGPPQAACGDRIFPEAALANGYIQYSPNPAGFAEYRHGLEFLAQTYPRWISVFTLRDRFNTDEAVSVGNDDLRPYEAGDTGDGHDILVVKITDHDVPDAGKETLTFSLSVHGNERGGLEGGVRTAEDLAIAAENGGTITDGVDNYESTTGKVPEFHDYPVADVLAQQAVYLIDFNIDGWVNGDTFSPNPSIYGRGNGMGTDLNRQMPTVGRIDTSRNPLQESEASYGVKFMQEVAAEGVDELMAYGADIHGELTSNAYMDIMYPAGQFNSVDHRRLMSIAERTKSVIDETLFEGIINEIEEASGGNSSSPPNLIPTKPAHWATVYDTLGYTDTGFIGDYMATDLAVTGMDYELFLNHTVPERVWTVALQENHINATRGIIKTAMAYAITQSTDFSDENVVIDTVGWAGYITNPDRVTDTDASGPGRLPGPLGDGVGADGNMVEQASYDVSNEQWFLDTNPLMPKPFRGLKAADVAADSAYLDQLDTLVLADTAAPKDVDGRSYDAADYWSNILTWVQKGGNLVLTDRAVHGLAELGLIDADAISDVTPYVPLLDSIERFDHPMMAGLRPNASQLVESPSLGYEIIGGLTPDEGAPTDLYAAMTVVDPAAWIEIGGEQIATTEGGVAVGQASIGSGQIRLVAGALPMPTEGNDHRYGLRSYAMTYTGLYIMENAIVYEAAGLGTAPTEVAGVALVGSAPKSALPTTGGGAVLLSLMLLGGALLARRRLMTV